MSKKQDQNASFMVRFNQQIFKENGDANLQWRGKISHIQGGDEQYFTDFNDALVFMQESKEEQESILQKSFAMWQTMKQAGPHFIKETIKNPKKQFSNLQEQIQDQFENLGEEISEKIPFDQWRKASRADYHKLQESIDSLTEEFKKLHKTIKEGSA